MHRPCRRACLAASLFILLTGAASAAEVELNGKRFTLADGFTIELAATAPLTERPICVDFDDHGRLYVAESSGTNDNVQKQLEDKPHSILRLEDTNGDGVFDRRTLFADRMMFPEGCEWHDGSLYVSAPPQIWKLTDTNDDGVADHREVWHDGKTLTGCANDLHGPYVGPDGLIYWCKGAFAEQSYELPNGKPFTTKASHIFRHDPRTGAVEPVLTGGMDNPVEIAFTRDGEPILSCTFLQRPAGGNRDGLIHAVYGGVWGKDHGVLDGHPRTGDLLPPLVHLGAAAPCGLLRVESREKRENAPLDSRHSSLDSSTLLACSFNMHKVTRHVLTESGGTYTATNDDLLSCDDVDFHPTDVIEDADGSLLVVDTGGWYKLCCPTSQLHKPDVPGAIYRLRRTGATVPADPRGLRLDWHDASPAVLADRLRDDRFAVRRRAVEEIAKHGEQAIGELARALSESSSAEARRLAVWTLTRIDSPAARAAVREILPDVNPAVRRSAIRSSGLWRDPEAAPAARGLLSHIDPHTRRAAAEALGRIGDQEAIPDLLTAAATADDDRFLHHAMTFALIEIADPVKTKAGLASNAAGSERAALLALSQMSGGVLKASEVVARLDSPHPDVRETAAWILEQHPEWTSATAEYFETKLRQPALTDEEIETTRALLARFAATPPVRDVLAAVLHDETTPGAARRLALETMPHGGTTLPASWTQALTVILESDDPAEVPLAVAAASASQKVEGDSERIRHGLYRVGRSSTFGDEVRLKAIRAASADTPLDNDSFEFLQAQLSEGSVGSRLVAADIFSAAALNVEQLRLLTESVPDLGPMELDRVLPAFTKATDEQTGLSLVASLRRSAAAGDLVPERLRAALAKFGPEVTAAALPLLERPQADEAERRTRLDEMLTSMANGDPGRGHAIFQSSKAACSACHAVGFLGGRIGPDLTGIGKIRTDRDLLEAILYPSASFVRSFEPVVVVTTSGQVHGGIPSEDVDALNLVTAADKSVVIPHDEIEEMRPGTVSVMPAGLEKQLSPQELADLIAFLKVTQ